MTLIGGPASGEGAERERSRQEGAKGFCRVEKLERTCYDSVQGKSRVNNVASLLPASVPSHLSFPFLRCLSRLPSLLLTLVVQSTLSTNGNAEAEPFDS